MNSKLPVALGALAGAIAVHMALVATTPTAHAQSVHADNEASRTAPHVVTAETDPAQLERFDVAPVRSDTSGALAGVALVDGPFVVTAIHTSLVLHLWVVPRGAGCGAIGSAHDAPGKVLTTGSHSTYHSSTGSRFYVKPGETLCAANGVADNAQMIAHPNASNDSVSGFRPY
jgi:hypothetical protein